MADGMIWPDGVDLLAFESIDSTNAEAARRAPSISRPTWISAKAQAAARGRRGRPWAMPPGNLAATLVLPLREPPARLALRSFVAALALFDAFVTVSGRPEAFALKWPNDVLQHGGKVAGILLETLSTGGLAIGFGVNLAAAPDLKEVEPGALPPVALCAVTGGVVPAEEILAHLASAFAVWEARFQAEGFAAIRAAWLARAAKIGQPIRARTVTEEIHGTFETVDSDGALILTTPKGRVSVQAAEIYF